MNCPPTYNSATFPLHATVRYFTLTAVAPERVGLVTPVAVDIPLLVAAVYAPLACFFSAVDKCVRNVFIALLTGLNPHS